MSKIILHIDQILNILYFVLFLQNSENLTLASVAMPSSTTYTGLQSLCSILSPDVSYCPCLMSYHRVFLTHYSAAYTATCEQDGGTNPAKRIKGEGEEEQRKGCLTQC